MNKKQTAALESLAKMVRVRKSLETRIDKRARLCFKLGLSSRQVAEAMQMDNASVWRRYVQK